MVRVSRFSSHPTPSAPILCSWWTYTGLLRIYRQEMRNLPSCISDRSKFYLIVSCVVHRFRFWLRRYPLYWNYTLHYSYKWDSHPSDHRLYLIDQPPFYHLMRSLPLSSSKPQVYDDSKSSNLSTPSPGGELNRISTEISGTLGLPCGHLLS